MHLSIKNHVRLNDLSRYLVTSYRGSTVVITDTLQLNYDGELFVFADSGLGDCERIIILATENNW